MRLALQGFDQRYGCLRADVRVDRTHPRNILEGNWRIVVFVDGDATDEQQQALLDVWTGKLGGPIADLAQLVGEVVAVERVPITFTVEGVKGTVRFGDSASAQLEPYKGATGEATTRESTHALRLGITHGVFSLGCCWSLMSLMVAVGIGSIPWMLALGSVMAVEKNVPWGRRLTAPVGVLLLGFGAVLVTARTGLPVAS